MDMYYTEAIFALSFYVVSAASVSSGRIYLNGWHTRAHLGTSNSPSHPLMGIVVEKIRQTKNLNCLPYFFEGIVFNKQTEIHGRSTLYWRLYNKMKDVLSNVRTYYFAILLS